MAGKHRADEAAARRRAEDDIARAEADSEVFAGSALSRQATRARAHFSGADAGPDDPVEIWGRRIGRGLSVVGVLLAILYLAATYAGS